MTKAQTRLVEDHLDLVHRIAHGIACSHRRLEIEDLKADGYVGLVQAARAFRRGRGCTFRTFATHRISGAIRDGIRIDQRAQGFMRNRGRVGTRVAWPLDANGEEDDSLIVDSSAGPFEQCLGREHRHAIRAVADDREQQILDGIQHEDSHEQIARRIGLSPSRVSQLCGALVTKVRSALVRAA